MGNEVQDRQTMNQEECPLVAEMGTPAAVYDNIASNRIYYYSHNLNNTLIIKYICS